jgi:branched-chain amino acid transport system permease protein
MVIGGTTSLTGAALGGIVVGLGESIAFTFFNSAVPGASALMVFGLVLLTLVLRPRGLLGRPT